MTWSLDFRCAVLCPKGEEDDEAEADAVAVGSAAVRPKWERRSRNPDGGQANV